MRRTALIIIVIGIMLSGYPIHSFSMLAYEMVFGILGDYTGLFFLMLFIVILITGGMIVLAVTLSTGYKETTIHIPSPIIVNVSYVKDIAVELASALSYYFYTPVDQVQ